ncbi:MAG: glycosyltransferase [Flavobacteriales bacterium]|nr:glycosyltransferase [Flavobacteriales bacterium]
MNPKVSIITVCYNSAETIEVSVKSVLSQKYNNIEYIIIDGYSTDTTKSIIEKYQSKITRFVSEKDAGIYFALNKGIELATGDIIGILHADDLYTSEYVISEVVETFAKSKADAVYANLQYVAKGNINKIIRHWVSGPYKENSFLYGWMPPHPTFFVRKEIYNKYGVFDTHFTSAADYELMLRFMHKCKISVAYLNKVIVKMRMGGKSNKSIFNRIKANTEDRKAWVVNGLKPYFFTLYLKPLRKITQFF